MGNIYLTLTAPSGGSYAATIERVSDGYYREDAAETFGSGLAFSDKDISLSEGSDENRGTYTTTLVGDSWNDGMYRVRIHDLDDNNNIIGADVFGVVDGKEVDVSDANSIVYHADIQFVRDSSNSEDNYMVRWYKNGALQYNITSPKLNIVDNDGVNIINNADMTNVGSGILTYRAINTERQTIGNLYAVESSGQIDSQWRKFAWILGRDYAS